MEKSAIILKGFQFIDRGSFPYTCVCVCAHVCVCVSFNLMYF